MRAGASPASARGTRRGRYVFVCTGKARSPSHRSSKQARPKGATQTASPISASSPGAPDPFAGGRLFVEPNSPADQTEQEWTQLGRDSEAAEIGKIAAQPVAKWFGDWSYGHGGTAGDVSWWVGSGDRRGGDAPAGRL